MIEIRVNTGARVRFSMDGHANFSPGSDIVCAAASMLAFTLLDRADTLCGAEAKSVCQSGSVRADFPRTPETAAALDTILAGFRLLAQQYPNNVTLHKAIHPEE